MGIIKILLIFLMLALTGYLACDYYLNYSKNQAYENENTLNIPKEVTQFVPNIRFENSRLSYYIDSSCSSRKKTNMVYAMFLLSNATQILSFYPEEKSNADVLIGCSVVSYSEEKNAFVAGEAKPTGYINLSYYPLIQKGKIILSKEFDCDYPILEMHELLHVFGFDHVNDKSNIMYPYADCNLRLDSKIANMLKSLYSIEPLPELLIKNFTIHKSDKYLNFTIEITNQGLKDAEGVSLDIYSNDNLIDSEEIGLVKIGEFQSIKVNNVKLSSTPNKIKFEIIYSGKEYDKSNNVLIL